jgi:hypothetical protein
MTSRKLTRYAAGAVAIAVAIGGYAVGNPSSSDSASGSANAAPAPAPQGGQTPPNWSPGTGTIITGAAADKARAAAVARYPEGTVNRVLKLRDGSYAVHRIGTSGQHHIFVSQDFKVTGSS